MQGVFYFLCNILSSHPVHCTGSKINTYLLSWTSLLTGSHGRHPVLGALVEECVPEGEEGVSRADRPPDQLHLRLVEQPRFAPLRVDVRVGPAIFNSNVMYGSPES